MLHVFYSILIIFFRTNGDGNCLFNACSLHLVQSETLFIHLRLLTAIELFEQRKSYAQHKIFKAAHDRGLFSTFDSAFCASISNSVLNSSEKSMINVEYVRQTALELLRFSSDHYSYSSFLVVMALGNAIKAPLEVICSKSIDSRLFLLYNCIIDPEKKENNLLSFIWLTHGKDYS